MGKRTLTDWIVATRPWSFTAAAMPVLVTLSYLYFWTKITGESCDWTTGWFTLPMLMLFQAAGNLISDYSDHVKGVDRPGSLNGVRHIQSGKFMPQTVLRYGRTLLGVSALIGLLILFRSSFEVFWIAVAAILLPLIYPWMKAHALGDLDILLSFALLPSVGVCYVTTGHYHWESLLLSLTYGLLTVAILHANNTRDIENDRRAGLFTLCGWVGGRASQVIYLLEILLPYILVGIFIMAGWLPAWTLLVLLTLPIAIRNTTTMMRATPVQEDKIPTLDKQTAELQMLFGLLLSISFLIARWLM